MNKQRLLKLAEHLESGELGHDIFDFNNYHEEKNCKTSGCAIGECPYVFPEDWIFDILPTLRDYSYLTVERASQKFFDLTRDEYYFIFTPSGPYNPEGYLPKNATKEEVAAHIRKFVEDESYKPWLTISSVKQPD